MRLLVLLSLLFLAPCQGWSCFGPKLYIAADTSPQQQVLYGLVSIYIREKTGIESELVPRDGAPVGELIRLGRADLEVGSGPAPQHPIWQVAQTAWLISGPRPVNELQFSLVPRALERLEQRLTGQQIAVLVNRVAAGEPPLAVARDFLQRQDWI